MPVSQQQLNEYRRKSERVIRQMNELSDEAAAYIRTRFSQFRHRMDDLIRATKEPALGGVISPARYGEMRATIEREVEALHRDLTDYLSRGTATSLNRGQAALVDGLDEMFHGMVGLLPSLTPELAVSMANLSADFVTGITDEVRKGINRELQVGMLGQKTTGEIIDKVQDVIGTEKAGSLYKAEAIVRTELQHAYNMVSYEKMLQLGQDFPGLMKTWHHQAGQLDPRPGHADADGQTVPINEPFRVRRSDKDKEEYPMYPGDMANASPENTVNCHCWMDLDPASIEAAIAQAEEEGKIPRGG